MKILTIISFLLFTGCLSKNNESLSEQFKFLKPKFESTVELFFSKNGVDLINDIENQTQQDFCKSNPFINCFVTKNKEKIYFPLFVYKDCNGRHVQFRNQIFININSKNEVLIDQEIFKPFHKIKNTVIKETESLLKRDNITIIYVLNWDTEVDSTLMTNRILELFSATKTIFNQLSIDKYKKTIDELTEIQLIELKKQFNPMIGLIQQQVLNPE